MAADQPPAAEGGASGSGSGGSFWTKRLGPYPVWMWAGALLVLALGYYLWKKRSAQASAATAANSTSTTTQGTDATQTAGQTPPFIIQNYTTTAPASSSTTATTGTSAGSTTSTSRPPWHHRAPLQGGNPPHQPITTGTGSSGTGTTATPPAGTTSTTTSAPTSSAQPQTYRVKAGDTLTSIAAKFDITNWQTLWDYNIGTGPGTANRDAATIATLEDRGPNDLVVNEEIYIPPK